MAAALIEKHESFRPRQSVNLRKTNIVRRGIHAGDQPFPTAHAASLT